mmetsp:Transcript_17043/g.52969  ORF Transcript_17043/g.52969 Transcript_17043/m.52969 type:complete len:117 (-) Transcript_17043:876-1226(-)
MPPLRRRTRSGARVRAAPFLAWCDVRHTAPHCARRARRARLAHAAGMEALRKDAGQAGRDKRGRARAVHAPPPTAAGFAPSAAREAAPPVLPADDSLATVARSFAKKHARGHAARG